MNKNIFLQVLLVVVVAFLGSSKVFGMALPHVARPPLDQAPSTSPTPTFDPQPTPVLPENPTEIDLGRYSYFFNCMPCHGDIGQGLTDDFRQTWVEDHQNCWARGCHGGRPQDEGFPIPTVIPAVILDSDALPRYHTFEDLYNYLRITHPPQRPGKLTDDDYRALTAFLWEENRKAAPEKLADPIATGKPIVTRTIPVVKTAVVAEPVHQTSTAVLVVTATPTAAIPPVTVSQSSTLPWGLIGVITIVLFLGAVLLLWRTRNHIP